MDLLGAIQQTQVLMQQGLQTIQDKQDDLDSESTDCYSQSQRSEFEQGPFKVNLIQHYQRADPNIPANLICMVLNQSLPSQFVIAAHIYMFSHTKKLRKFGLGESNINDPRNGLLLAKAIETAFDFKHVCFLYNANQQQFVFRVLNPTLFNKPVHANFPAITFGSLDPFGVQHSLEWEIQQRQQWLQQPQPQHLQGLLQHQLGQLQQQLGQLPNPLPPPAILQLPAGVRPWRRLLGYQARRAFLFAKRAEWISPIDYELFKQHEHYVMASQGDAGDVGEPLDPSGLE